MWAVASTSVILFLITACIGESSAGVPLYREDNEECTTPVCQKTAEYLLASMNTSVNPCQDFYQYACGGWLQNHPIPEEKYEYSTFNILVDEVLDDITGILRNASREAHARAVHDTAEFFESCTDTESRETAGLDSLKSLLNELGGWPMITPDWSSESYEWHKKVATVKRILGVPDIISVHVDADANQTSQQIIYMDQPGQFGTGRNQLIHKDSEGSRGIITAYKNFIVATGKLLNPNADETKLRNDADEMIEFESKLAQYSKPPEKMRDISVLYNKMTLAEVQAVTENTGFQWTDFLNKILADFSGVTSETEVILSAKDYFRDVLKLIRDNYSTNPRVLANYIGWIVLKNVGQYTTKAFRNNKVDYEKVAMGIQKEDRLERQCARLAIDILGNGVGRLYVDKFFTEEAKQNVDELVDNIKSAYKSSLRSNTWMDEVTKTKAIEKVDAMLGKMGYPEWIKDDDKLNEYYSSIANSVRREEFFASFLRVMKGVSSIALKKWNQPTDRVKDWQGVTSAVVNAYYSPNTNSIIFPAAILRLPIYEYGRTSAVNYGGVGFIIGHEVSHGFDDLGSQFDSEGNLVNWWSEDILETFKEKADCFRTQYSSIVEPTTNMNLNGNSSLGENIADNGAVRNAFNAYKAGIQSRSLLNKRLPGISATPEQLFFIGFSSTWCAKERKESMIWSIQYDYHSLKRYRATVPLMNSEEFAQAFDCPLGSPMNPEKKCFLW